MKEKILCLCMSVFFFDFALCSSAVGKYIEDGLYKELYDTGEVHRLITYKNGGPNGAFNTFYKNGQLLGEGLYVNGVLEKKAIGY